MCTSRKAPLPRTDLPQALAMATSIISVLTGIPVRRDVAMTGEITLRGRVLPIGGLKEKLSGRASDRTEDRDHSGGERKRSRGNS